MSTGTRRQNRRSLLVRYLAGATLARTADEGARVSLVLLAVRETGSAAIGGALVAALLLPHVIAAPMAGMVIDRAHEPARVLAVAITVFAVTLLAVAWTLGRVALWIDVLLLLVGGCCGPAITGGLSSHLPGLVEREQVPRAFGLDSLFYNIASMTGPAIAGLTAAAAGPRVAQAGLAASAVTGALWVATVPFHKPPAAADGTAAGLFDGAREIWRQPALRVLTASSTVGQVGPGGLAVVAVVLAASTERPSSSGLLLTALAAGSLVGSLLWTWRPVAVERPDLVTTVAMVGVGTPLALSAVHPTLTVTAALFALSGFFVGPFASALFTSRTRYSAATVRTQVFTIGAGLKVTASAIGAALIGLAAGLPIRTQLLLVASSPLLAGTVGTLVLTMRGNTGARSPGAPSPRAR